MQENGRREEFERLFGRVARFDSGKHRDINLPDRCREVSRVALGLVPLLPAEKAWLVLSLVKRARQYRLDLDPDDLLMNEDPAVTHCFLNLDLTL